MREIKLNIQNRSCPAVLLNVSQFDKGYEVTATVYNGITLFTPPTGSTATVEGRKPDNTGYQYPATIDGSTVTFTVMEQMTVLSGRSMAEIVFYDADAVRIGTANFYIIVEAAPLNDNTVISETDLPTIQQALDLLKNGALAPGIIGTASGDVAAFADGARDTALSSLAVEIDPVQSGSGDPSPTNIRPISGWTEANVTRAGKNLTDFKSVYDAVSGVTYSNETWTAPSNGFRLAHIPIPKSLFGTELTFSALLSTTGTNIRVAAIINGVTKNGTTVSDATETQSTITFTPLTEDDYIFINYSTAGTATVKHPQLEIGTTATAYEEYKGETFPVALPTEAGTVYGGVVDPVKGTLTVEDVGYTFKGTETVVAVAPLGNTTRCRFNNSDMGGLAVATNGALLCSHGVCAADHSGDYVHAETTTNYTYLFVPLASATAAEIQAYLKAQYEANTPWQLVYKLATPLEYELTPTQIKTLYGYNTIYADCGSIESVEYTADTKMYIDAKIAELQALVLENA